MSETRESTLDPEKRETRTTGEARPRNGHPDWPVMTMISEGGYRRFRAIEDAASALVARMDRLRPWPHEPASDEIEALRRALEDM